jgi:transcriptional regulator GlxA family with amidase domain
VSTSIAIAPGPHAVPSVKVQRRLHIAFVLAKHFTLSAFSLFVDTLRLGAGVDDRSDHVFCQWDVVSSSKLMIASSSGIQVSPTAEFGDAGRYDYIVVVGGPLNVEESIDRAGRAFLRDAASKRLPLIGLCTGSFLLAEIGLLNNRLVCVSWLHHQLFRDRFPGTRVTSNELFVEDRKIITSAGGSAVADVAAFLVRRHIGLEAEKNVLEMFHIERRGRGTERQNRMPASVPSRQDQRIRASLLYMERCLDEKVEFDSVARTVGVSRRQLERLFAEKMGASPREALTKIRLNRACTLLEETSQPILDVALEVGFENCSHFTKKFREMVGLTPTSFRRQKQALDGKSPRFGGM